MYLCVLAIEIYFASRVAWFTMLSCKKLRGNLEFENGLRKIRCYMYRSRELTEINGDIFGVHKEL